MNEQIPLNLSAEKTKKILTAIAISTAISLSACSKEPVAHSSIIECENKNLGINFLCEKSHDLFTDITHVSVSPKRLLIKNQQLKITVTVPSGETQYVVIDLNQNIGGFYRLPRPLPGKFARVDIEVME